MAVPPEVFPRLSGLKRVVSRQNDLLIQDAVARWMRSGGFERHLRRTRRCYEERRDVLLDCLENARSLGIEGEAPDGGMAVWAKTRTDSARIAERARKAGIWVGHEAEFRVRGERARGLRLAFARHSPAEIRAGIAQLLELID
jgi:GntR family transcriptional regulator/MocR family aminotransferase